MEKKKSLKEAQQYIRTSLRKFKIKRKKSGSSDASNSSDPKPSEETTAESNESKFVVNSEDSFFSSSMTQVEEVKLTSDGKTF